MTVGEDRLRHIASRSVTTLCERCEAWSNSNDSNDIFT